MPAAIPSASAATAKSVAFIAFPPLMQYAADSPSVRLSPVGTWSAVSCSNPGPPRGDARVFAPDGAFSGPTHTPAQPPCGLPRHCRPNAGSTPTVHDTKPDSESVCWLPRKPLMLPPGPPSARLSSTPSNTNSPAHTTPHDAAVRAADRHLLSPRTSPNPSALQSPATGPDAFGLESATAPEPGYLPLPPQSCWPPPHRIADASSPASPW